MTEVHARTTSATPGERRLDPGALGAAGGERGQEVPVEPAPRVAEHLEQQQREEEHGGKRHGQAEPAEGPGLEPSPAQSAPGAELDRVCRPGDRSQGNAHSYTSRKRRSARWAIRFM
jgi:hypothetical protein